jgi:hypothetical protein
LGCEWLSSNNPAASFLLIDRNKIKELRILPDEDVVVKITDDEQINKQTVFVD